MAEDLEAQMDQLNGQVAHLYGQGWYAQAIAVANQLRELMSAHHGTQHPLYAHALNTLAMLYDSQGDYAACEPLYREAMEIRRAVLPEDHPDLATSLNNLASMYFAKGDYPAAEPLLKQALEIRQRVLGEDDRDYATSLNNLGMLYQTQGNYAAAEPLYRQAARIQRGALGEGHPEYAGSLNNLAALCQARGNYVAARTLYRQSLEIRRGTLGESHPDYAASLNNLARLYQAMGEYGQAEPLFLQALEIDRQVLGENNPGYAGDLGSLALLYQAQGKLALAEPLHQQAIAINRAALGDAHPAVAGSLNDLAALYVALGREGEADPLYREALAIRRRALGAQHPDVAASLAGQAGMHCALNNLAAAEALYQEALTIYRQALTEEHPFFARCLNELADLYRAAGNPGAAIPCCEQALATQQRMLGEDHPDYAATLNTLAGVHCATGNFTAAEPHLRQALSIRRRMLGEDHPDCAATRNLLAKLYQQRPFIEAEDIYVVGRPVEGRLFVGRNDIVKTIKDNLAPRAGKNILVLRGQRRTGKSSVLLRLRDTLARESEGNYLPVFVDLQAMSMIRDEGQFFYELAYRIWDDLRKQSVSLSGFITQDIDLPPPILTDYEKDPTIAFEQVFLDRLWAAWGNRQVLLMLDEFETLQSLIERGRLSGELLGYCRHLMQHSRLLFLIAGTQKLRELTGAYWSVFFNLTVPIDIGTLKEAEARWLITEPVQPWYLIEPNAQDEIIRVTGCHPYFTQMVCKQLLEVRNEAGLNVVGSPHVAEAVNRTLQSGEDQIGYPWTESDCLADERLVLSVLAEEACKDAGVPIGTIRRRLEEAGVQALPIFLGAPVAVATIRRRLEEAGVQAAVGNALSRLQARSIVRQDEAERVSFVVPLLQNWIVRKRFDSLAETRQYNEEQQAAEGSRGDPAHG